MAMSIRSDLFSSPGILRCFADGGSFATLNGNSNPYVRFGHKQTYAAQNDMSALPPKADLCSANMNVRFGPKADMATALGFLQIQIPLSNQRFAFVRVRLAVDTFE